MSTARLLAGGAAAAVALALVPVTPAHADSGLSYSLTIQGLNAYAVFSDAPADGPPVAGIVYHETAVGAGELGAREGGPSQGSPYLYVDQLVYSVDEQGDRQWISEAIGFASDATYEADRRLSQASARGTVTLRTCDASGTCVDGETIAVDVQWTGYGDVGRSRGTSVDRGDDGTVFMGHGSDALRAATAVADFPEPLVEALLDHITFSEKCIGSGC
jgi:hypothetical protein